MIPFLSENDSKKFDDFHQGKFLEMVKSRASITLEWYETIGTMLDDDEYEYTHKFLQSVADQIEKKEYISDKQIIAIENMIESHKDFGHGDSDKEYYAWKKNAF